jgi:ketosteroid isomerase-like protein
MRDVSLFGTLRRRVTQASDEIEAIRRFYAAFEPAFSGREVEGFLEQITPDVEWAPILAALEGRVYRGHAGVHDFLEDLRRDWEVFEPIVDEIRDLGRGHFLVLGRWRARGRGSGVELQTQPATWLIRRRDGRMARIQTFTRRQDALEEAERLRSAGRRG